MCVRHGTLKVRAPKILWWLPHCLHGHYADDINDAPRPGPPVAPPRAPKPRGDARLDALRAQLAASQASSARKHSWGDVYALHTADKRGVAC